MKSSRNTSKIKTKISKKPLVVIPKAPRRQRQSGVRERVLSLLADGPITNAALLKKGKFTHSALYLHVRSLRAAGIVASHRSGRSVMLSLKSVPAPKAERPKIEEPLIGEVVNEAPKPKAPKASSSALVPAMVSPQLRDALHAVAFRLSPIERGEEKLLVLDQLSHTMPAAVAEVLRSVIDDLVKFSTFHPQSES